MLLALAGCRSTNAPPVPPVPRLAFTPERAYPLGADSRRYVDALALRVNELRAYEVPVEVASEVEATMRSDRPGLWVRVLVFDGAGRFLGEELADSRATVQWTAAPGRYRVEVENWGEQRIESGTLTIQLVEEDD